MKLSDLKCHFGILEIAILERLVDKRNLLLVSLQVEQLVNNSRYVSYCNKYIRKECKCFNESISAALGTSNGIAFRSK